MTTRFLIAFALFASAAVGAGGGVLVSQVTSSKDERQDVRSISGVNSGVDGTQEKQPDKKGVDQVLVPPETPMTAAPATETVPDEDNAQSQTVDIEGVEGTEGIGIETENTIQIITTNEGSMQSIRGIKGIDTVMLQNLEAVLRMQAPPPPPEEGGGGGVRAAAALLTMESDQTPDPEDEIDGREELTEFEFEGS